MSDALNALPAKLPAAHERRLSWALRGYGSLLPVAVAKDTSPEARQVELLPYEDMAEHVARLILEGADPTVAKTMTGWLVKQYVQGGLRLEDLGTASETLDMFQRYAYRLPKAQRDLGQYKSLAAVWDMVFPLAEAEQSKFTSKARKAMEKTRAYAESHILRQDEDGFSIAVPLTEFAAKWWGRGTRWCTASGKYNRFWEYHKVAPLIVFVIPELGAQGKFQMWATGSDFQFMDAADRTVSLEVKRMNWRIFEPFMHFAVTQAGRSILKINETLITLELWENVVRQNGMNLSLVPNGLRTEGLYRIAVAQSGHALGYVPLVLRTDEMCRIAVAQNGRALYYVPEKLRTEELCRLAVEKDGLALGYVPANLRTEDLCRIAVAQAGLALGEVPHAMRTEEMCKIAVSQDSRNGSAISAVPKNFLTDEFYRDLVRRVGLSLNVVPARLRTLDMYRLAVQSNGVTLIQMPEAWRTADICKMAVGQKGAMLMHVPYRHRTYDLCELALRHGASLEYVPNRLRTSELCELAIRENGGNLKWVPKALKSSAMCELAVRQSAWALQYVPQALRTLTLSEIALQQNGMTLRHVPFSGRTMELCRIAVTENSSALDYVPKALRSKVATFQTPNWKLNLLEQLASAVERIPRPKGMENASGPEAPLMNTQALVRA